MLRNSKREAKIGVQLAWLCVAIKEAVSWPMAMAVQDFVRRLVHGRLFTEREAAEYLATFPPEKLPADGDALANALIRDERLTPWQAEMILQGNEKGIVLGEFVLLTHIGKGGMGDVFKAVHRPSGTLAAIKVLPEAAMSPPQTGPLSATQSTRAQADQPSAAIGRFHQEIMAASRLCHRNIVATYDAGEQDGVHYLVMEFVDGEDLNAWMRTRRRADPATAVNWILQAARGLRHAHGQNVIHRDIKPGNLLLDREGTIKILDLGLARVVEEEMAPAGATLAERLTVHGQMLGTVDYISPEQAVDTRSADRRSDIYSLGCTLYRLVTGRVMFEGETPVAKLMAHLDAPIPSLRDARPEVSPQLDRVFRKMVAKSPADRYQSMDEVIVALEACPESSPRAALARGCKPRLASTGHPAPAGPGSPEKGTDRIADATKTPGDVRSR